MTFSYFFDCKEIICDDIKTYQLGEMLSKMSLSDFLLDDKLYLPFRFCSRIPMEIQYQYYYEILKFIDNDQIKTLYSYIYLNPSTYYIISVLSMKDTTLGKFLEKYVFAESHRDIMRLIAKNCGCKIDIFTYLKKPDMTLSRLRNDAEHFKLKETSQLQSKNHTKHFDYHNKVYRELNMSKHSKLKLATIKLLTFKEVERIEQNKKRQKEKELREMNKYRFKPNIRTINKNFCAKPEYVSLIDGNLFSEMHPNLPIDHFAQKEMIE
jgi:hypothetical protein